MAEDKQRICDALCRTLQETYQHREVKDIWHDTRQELVYVKYAGNISRIIDVFNCTGIDMIRKILSEIQ